MQDAQGWTHCSHLWDLDSGCSPHRAKGLLEPELLEACSLAQGIGPALPSVQVTTGLHRHRLRVEAENAVP